MDVQELWRLAAHKKRCSFITDVDFFPEWLFGTKLAPLAVTLLCEFILFKQFIPFLCECLKCLSKSFLSKFAAFLFEFTLYIVSLRTLSKPVCTVASHTWSARRTKLFIWVYISNWRVLNWKAEVKYLEPSPCKYIMNLWVTNLCHNKSVLNKNLNNHGSETIYPLLKVSWQAFKACICLCLGHHWNTFLHPLLHLFINLAEHPSCNFYLWVLFPFPLLHLTIITPTDMQLYWLHGCN